MVYDVSYRSCVLLHPPRIVLDGLQTGQFFIVSPPYTMAKIHKKRNFVIFSILNLPWYTPSIFAGIYTLSILPWYISCSRLCRLLFMYKICRFLWLKFKFPITFFSIRPIYMIYMKDREQVWNFWTPTKKRVKRIKKEQNLIFCKKVKILKKPWYF